jgi:ferric-dicitrate binding protein FerR (iron transport regulator)
MRTVRQFSQFAGFLTCLALLPLALWLAGRRSEPMATVTATGVRMTLELPDGSRAAMTAGTRLRYAPDFAHRRTIWLFGEAALEIKPGSEFALWTETALVKTVGGRLSVRAVDRETTFVVVSEGRANVRALNEDNDPAYSSLWITSAQSALALKTVGVKSIQR